MIYIPKNDYHLEILTEEEVKIVSAINFSDYFKSTREEQNLRKIDNHFIYLLRQHLMK